MRSATKFSVVAVIVALRPIAALPTSLADEKTGVDGLYACQTACLAQQDAAVVCDPESYVIHGNWEDFGSDDDMKRFVIGTGNTFLDARQAGSPTAQDVAAVCGPDVGLNRDNWDELGFGQDLESFVLTA